MPRQKKSAIPSAASAYLAEIGARGGRAGTGSAKARTSEQARAAALARVKKQAGRKPSA